MRLAVFGWCDAIGFPEGASFLKRVEKLWDKLFTGVGGKLRKEWTEVLCLVGELQQAANAAGAIIGFESALSGGPTPANVPRGFRHPADTNNDGKLVGSELKGRD